MDFSWDLPLEALNEDFGFLSTLLKLENVLEEHFQKKIALLEHIDATFNTPQDIVNLIL